MLASLNQALIICQNSNSNSSALLFSTTLPDDSEMNLPFCRLYNKRMWPIFNAEMFIYQSKANVDKNILFGRVTHL